MAKIALFFVLEKPTLPDNFGIKMSMPSVAPFYESISRDSNITKLNYSGCTAYNFRFFRKPFQTDVLLILKDYDYHTSSDIEENCRRDARGVLDIAPDKDFEDKTYTQRAMWLPKGVTRQEFNNLTAHFSKTTEVDPDNLTREDIPGGWMMMHPDGFILGSKSESDFLKAAACYAISLALQKQSKESIERLSLAAATAGSQLPRLCEDISRFQCQYGFKNPLDTVLRSDAVEFHLLAGKLAVPELLQELNDKVSQAIHLMQSRLMGKGQIDDLEPFSADSESGHSNRRKMAKTDEGQSNHFSRTILAIVILAVAGSVTYLVGTDAGQKQWHSWTSHPAADSSESKEP